MATVAVIVLNDAHLVADTSWVDPALNDEPVKGVMDHYTGFVMSRGNQLHLSSRGRMLPSVRADSRVMDKPVLFAYFGLCSSVTNWMERVGSAAEIAGMPRQSTVTEIRLNDIKGCLTPALTLLKELNDAFCPPFIQCIANTIETLINMVQNVKQNKDQCIQLMENIHPVLYAIINLHLKAETVESLSPAMLNNIGKFMETLHKIYTFLEAQQDGNRIKHLFRNNEIQKLFKDCHAGLDQAVEVFEITTKPTMFSEIDAIKETAQLMHEELLELIQTLSDASTDSGMSSPKIFHGRESEVDSIMKMLGQVSPRIAILGGGGMGKTSLARAVLHHPDTCDKFEYRFLVSAESATTSIELAALIGLHVGLNAGTNLTRPVVQYLSQKPSCVLVLDNLETVWEPMQSRGRIEEFLLLLAGVKHLALITMSMMKRIAQILQFTDNMPLVVDLIAHWADYEGLSNVLARWETERTALLSVGITSESKVLLSLLSILPDGLSDAELVQSNLPVRNILSCKTALLATSLAYQDSKRRLRSLMPVREHVQQFLPPSLGLLQCLRKLFYTLLELYYKYNGEQLGPVINQITLNMANFHEVLQQGLYNHAPDLEITVHSISSLNSFYRLTGRGYTVLMDCIRPILPGLDDHLKIQFTIEILKSSSYYPCRDQEQLIIQAPSMLEHINNPLLEYKNEQCTVLLRIGTLKCGTGDYSTAQAHVAQALQLLKSAPNLFQVARALWVGALCSTYLGKFLQAIDNLNRGRIILGICGLAEGDLAHTMIGHQAEIHLLKSEYAQARNIHSQIVATVSLGQNAWSYAVSLLNIAQIDVMCGDTMDVYHKLNQAKEIFNKFNNSKQYYCL
ncbi:hypothetical protein DFH08DRAFT_811234 [Mycena albidolilacea]|uniref:Novel STAND NTPase 1 domain-containing protein n=1 Tax=Mycena albidolilacea TaxID=1033008 RepID=A0AAD7EP93_9AGAR|nr:hypothetical protein DFH08DRAFT_811234 [Mycena albidolilacea]